jgi:hypothetical protein
MGRSTNDFDVLIYLSDFLHSFHVSDEAPVRFINHRFGEIMLCSPLVVIECKTDEFTAFNPPSGQTCLNWANEFVTAFGGYLDNLSDLQSCRYCPYSVRIVLSCTSTPAEIGHRLAMNSSDL